MASVPACTPERIQELRTAFNDPNYLPAYCTAEDGAAADAQLQETTPFPIAGVIVVGLLIWYLMKKG